jgi:hypothetical protein
MSESESLGTPQQELAKLERSISDREVILKVPSVSTDDRAATLEPIMTLATSSPYYCVRNAAAEYMRAKLGVTVHPNEDLGLRCVG